MATGREEDALLGSFDDDLTSESKQIFNALTKIQSTMDTVATGINKMGDAFSALAASGPRSMVTDQPSTSSKRSAALMEEGETDDSEYDDNDDVKSLLESGNSGVKADLAEDQPSGSVLEEMDALLEDDDDVGLAISEKLANITNKAFSKQHSIDAVKKKKESHKRPKNCETRGPWATSLT